jgi:hypothetical protein
MSRKKLTIEDWKGSITLLITVLQDHNKNFDVIVAARNKIENIDELSPIACINLETDLEVFCNNLSKDIWEIFLKKRRDKKYVSESSRKRLSVHSDTFDELSKLIKANKFDNANHAIEFLLQKYCRNESCALEELCKKDPPSSSGNVPSPSNITIKKTAIRKPITIGISIDGVRTK